MGMSPVWDNASDEGLLATARIEPGAFGAFYRRHEDRVFSYFLARVGDAEVAADLTAETFAAALASAHRFGPRKTPASAWLLGIASNNLAMSRRKGRVEARARRRLGMAPLVLTDESVERIAALDGSALELASELPGDQQDAIRARVIDERDYADIAKDMRCSEAVVRKRVSRGLGTLRGRLEEKKRRGFQNSNRNSSRPPRGLGARVDGWPGPRRARSWQRQRRSWPWFCWLC
jgi:RNA polymerase sigma factor (sigma-70 family)